MSTDLTDQLRDYLDQVDPVTVEDIVEGTVVAGPSERRRGPHLAAVVAVGVLALGGLTAVLFGQGPGSSGDGWCPQELRTSWDQPPVEFCDGAIVGSWVLASIEVGGADIPIPPFDTRDWTWVGLDFRNDGSWSGQFCNMISGFYQIGSESIFSAVGGATLADCHGAEGVVERTMFSFLDRERIHYNEARDELELRNGQTVIGLARLESRLHQLDLACGSLDGTDTGEVYYVSATISADAEGRLQGVDREGGRSPETAFNGIARTDLAAMVRLAESNSSVVFAAFDSFGKVNAAVKVHRYGEQWIATEGVFCDSTDIWRSE